VSRSAPERKGGMANSQGSAVAKLLRVADPRSGVAATRQWQSPRRWSEATTPGAESKNETTPTELHRRNELDATLPGLMIFWSDDPDSTVRVGFANISTRGER